MTLIDANSWRRRIGLTTVLIAAGLAAAGCGSSSSAASPTVTATSTPHRYPAGHAFDANRIGDRMITAVRAAGGSTMQVTAGVAQLSGTFAFGSGEAVPMLFPSRGAGRLTASGRSIDWVLDVPEQVTDLGFYVNDGTLVNDRHWARVPPDVVGLDLERDGVQALLKAHPGLVFVPVVVEDTEPDILATYVSRAGSSLRSLGAETVGGLAVTHYRFTVDGKTPKAGAKNTFEIWIDQQGRPAKYVSNERGFTTTASYSHWGKQPSASLPPASDVSVLPLEP